MLHGISMLIDADCLLLWRPTQAAYKRLEGCIPGDMQAVLKHGRDAFKSTTKVSTWVHGTTTTSSNNAPTSTMKQ